MGVKITGVTDLRKRFDNTGRAVSRAGSDALRHGARKLRDRSRDYAPVEFENLEQSITLESENIGRNQWSHVVFVDKNFPATERGARITVGKYADIVHEGGTGGIGRGPASLAKAAALGVDVGPFFMSRAFEELAPEIRKDVARAVSIATATGMAPQMPNSEEEQRIAAARPLARKKVKTARKAAKKTSRVKANSALRAASKKVKTAKVAKVKTKLAKVKTVKVKSKAAVNAAVKKAVQQSAKRTAASIKSKVPKVTKPKVTKPKKTATKKVAAKKATVKKVTLKRKTVKKIAKKATRKKGK